MTFAVEELKSSDIINFLTGCTEFEVESPEPEKLLTSCMEKNVDIWAIRRIDACTLRFRCRLPDEKEVRQICDVCGATSVGEVSTGLPIRAKGRMRRWGFLAGVILFFALIILMSNVIWRVDTVGYKDKTQLTEVECFLRERGLTVGALRGMLDEQTLRRDLMRNFEDIAGATVNFFGSVAVVELEPAVPKPEIEITEPANLIAEEDAQIIEITVFNGVPAVKKNDIVRKGQLLVGGVYDSKRIGYRPVHARALIKARVNRTLDVFVPYEQDEIRETGKEKTVYTLTLFGASFDLNGCDYESFRKTSSSSDLRISEHIILPVRLTKTKCFQTETAHLSLTEEQAYEKAIALLDDAEARGMKNLEIECRLIETKYTSQGVYVAYRYSVVTEIGTAREIKITEIPKEETERD